MFLLGQLESALASLSDPRVRRGLWIAAVWVVTLVAARFNGRFFDQVDAQLSNYNVPERRLAKLDALVDILLVVIAALVTLHILGVSQALWGAVAVTGIVGAIVALAAQRLGQNLLAGLVIMFERPFILGDTVEVKGQVGTVRKVTLHSTVLETPDGPEAILPNSELVNGAIVNLTASRARRITVAVDVEEAVDMDRVRAVLHEAVEGEEHLVEERPARIYAQASLDQGVRYEVRYWVQRDHYSEHCLPSAMERMLDALNDAGLTTAMPAQTVVLKDQGTGVEV